MPDVPAEFTGEVSGFTDDSPEATNVEGAQVEGEARRNLRLTRRLKRKRLLSRPRRRLLSSPPLQSKPIRPRSLARGNQGATTSAFSGRDGVY
ncbi:hypothetical protein Nepgr_005980 [Nepenthes gracilis]|uniref:Uncharacterized protein n=1 Tax=Nepenthes gracilis TaxID=150966 RepID=A0AAD3XH50_NEPGR|nr:hypothetical protein Nepgr_005980 [Nepenthes gracilis]